ncbi:MAG: ABC transporter permease [Proteobacteria bacterium]|nr:ABC transporter permease [Pseudomonadota bacterium]MBI3505759.1 ABC transporter permease [Pseudomonadota bacterium]
MTATVANAGLETQPRRWLALRRLLADPLGRLGLILVVVVVAGAVGADLIATHDPFRMAIRDRLQAPSLGHLLGTDNLGRDVFSRVLYGGRIALWVSSIAVSSSLAIGLVLGMLAGYGPRWLDNILLLVFDAVRSFPTIMFAMAVVTLIGPSLSTIILIVVVTSMPLYGRIVRTQTLSLKAQEFILAEQALGAGTFRVLASHMLPNVIGPVLILASMEIPVVITLEAGLSFLGFGVRPPTPSWGSILNDGYQFIRETPWLVVAGGVPLVVSTLGFTLLGEALRDIFDPKLARD